MAGAALLAGKAAMRTGLGLLTFHVPESLLSIVQLGLPEAMANTDNMNDLINNEAIKNKYQAIAIGPGIGKNDQTLQMLETLISINKKTPFVIDADAIHLCALLKQKNPNWQFPELAVLTPHPKELISLVGNTSNSFDQLEKAKQFAAENKVIIVLKGAYTRIINPNGEVTFNGTGNALLSTAGSGDVLTGIIAGLLAQGYPAFIAAQYGVWLHGKCAQSLQSKGIQTAIASDLIAEIPFLI
jgi:NAD(P)H-hydrate epimerase